MKNFYDYLEAVQKENRRSRKIYLDDERIPYGKWLLVKTQKQFEEATGGDAWMKYTHFSFDNDLGTGNGSGIGAANFLKEQILNSISKIGTLKLNLNIRVHSHNPVASNSIYKLFDGLFSALKERGNISKNSKIILTKQPAIPKKEFTMPQEKLEMIKNEVINKSIASVTKQQGISCGREDCSNASAAFVYHANTGKTVKAGITKKWKDGESGPWYLAYVVVNGAPHNVAYNSKTGIIVDLTLGQFENYKDLETVILQKENYLKLINSKIFNIQKYTIGDTLQVLYKQPKNK